MQDSVDYRTLTFAKILVKMLQLFLRNLTGSTICIEAQDASQPVAELKALIQQQEGVPCEHCGLVYAGRQLQDERSLESYAIGEGSTVHLVLRLRGGKGGFGALLRGQGRDGKVTTNFDAMRDLQGRRLRHQVAEQKLQEWKSQAKERELEKIAQQHITELARQQKKEEREKVRSDHVGFSMCAWCCCMDSTCQALLGISSLHSWACSCAVMVPLD